MTMKIQSNDLALELKEPYGSLVLDVMQTWKGPRKYKIDKLAIDIYKKISEIPIPLVKEAIKRYKKSKSKEDPGKVPHPSYFIAIVKRLVEESSRTKNNSTTSYNAVEKVNWGKGI